MRLLRSYDELLAASRGDAFVRWEVPRRSTGLRAWALRNGVVFARRGPSGRRSLTVVAPPDQAAAALRQHLDGELDGELDGGTRGALAGVTVPQGTLELLGPDPRIGAGNDWEWMWTSTAPPLHPGSDRVEHLGADDLDDVRALLERSSPRHSVLPGAAEVVRWLGVRDASGALLACGAHTEHLPGVPHLASIATDPAARGQGLGAAVTAELTRAALQRGAPVVTLGMYSDNDVARRMYARLGLRCQHRWSSRALLPGAVDGIGELAR